MTDLWENIDRAIETVKNFCILFYDYSISVFNIFPSPFKEILIMALLVTIASVIIKVVRG